MNSNICDYIISLVIGLVTGLLSSYFVSKTFRDKDNERDKNTFIREMNRYISNMKYSLLDVYEHASNKTEPREAYESIKDSFYYKPNYEERFKLNDFQKKKVETYLAINERIAEKIKELKRIRRRIDGVLSGDYLDSMDNLEEEKWALLCELGVIFYECQNFLEESSRE